MCLRGTWTVEKDVMNLKFVGVTGILSKQAGPGCVIKVTSSAGQVINIKAVIHVTF